jgi:hypothetical protein
MSESRGRKIKPKVKEAEAVEAVDSVPAVAEKVTDMVRVNMWVTKDLHKRLRIYAINHDDKTIVSTIQDILEYHLNVK